MLRVIPKTCIFSVFLHFTVWGWDSHFFASGPYPSYILSFQTILLLLLFVVLVLFLNQVLSLLLGVVSWYFCHSTRIVPLCHLVSVHFWQKKKSPPPHLAMQCSNSCLHQKHPQDSTVMDDPLILNSQRYKNVTFPQKALWTILFKTTLPRLNLKPESIPVTFVFAASKCPLPNDKS